MADGTVIEWTDATWNPIRARHLTTGGIGHLCVCVSDGCRHCYAERLQSRFNKPVRYAAQDSNQVELFLDRDALLAPLRWTRPRTIFVYSMTDIFYEGHPDTWIDQVFAVMAACPEHSFQVLTKRPARMADYLVCVSHGMHGNTAWAEAAKLISARPRLAERIESATSTANLPLTNVRTGVSTENRETAEERAPALPGVSVAVRYLSMEPLLADPGELDLAAIDWVIVGGESGPAARPMHPDWARSVRNQCETANVPFFFKQWGEWGWLWSQRKPESRPEARQIGRKAASRELDGRESNDMPPRHQVIKLPMQHSQ